MVMPSLILSFLISNFILAFLTTNGKAEMVLWYFFIWLFGTIILDLIISFFLSGNRYKHQYYWITNKRIIFKRGLFGYRITSLPLERISDIIITRTLVERIFGFASLHIQSLAGQYTVTTGHTLGLGAEASLLAVPEPETLQEFIFKLIKEKRKKEGLTI